MKNESQYNELVNIIGSTSYWSAGIFNSWTEGRGLRAFKNCSIKSLDGKFRTESEALLAAEKVIKSRSLSGVWWNSAIAVASFRIPMETNEKIGKIMDAIMLNKNG